MPTNIASRTSLVPHTLPENPSLKASVGDVAQLLATKVDALDGHASAPLNAGRFTLPTDMGFATVKVKEGTTASISFHADNVDGKPALTRAQLNFVDAQNKPRPIILKNPSKAGEDSSGFWKSISTWFKDALVDVRLVGVSLDQDGNLELSGRITGLNRLIDLPLAPKVPALRMPAFHRDLEALIQGNAILTPAEPMEGAKPVDIDALTSEIAKIISLVNYDMSHDIDRFVLVKPGSEAQKAFGAERIHAEIAGSAHVGFASGGKPFVRDAQAVAGVQLSNPVAGVKRAKYEHFSADSVSLKGEVNLCSTEVPGELTGRANVGVEAEGVSVKFGPIRADVLEPVGLNIDLNPLSFNPEGKTFAIEGSGELPESLTSFVDTLKLEVTQDGGLLTLTGDTDVDDFKYTRKIPAAV